MKINKTIVLVLILYHIPDILLGAFLYFILNKGPGHINAYSILLILAVFFALRLSIFILLMKQFYFNRLNIIKDIISDFRKGKFIVKNDKTEGKGDFFQGIMKDLVITGKYLEEVVKAQGEEIDTLHEFYNNIVFSISSFFIVIGDDEKIMYANDGFCKKFRFEKEDIAGKRIEDIFYFVNARLKGAILKVKTSNKPVILEQTHLLSVNKISIISDIKITKIIVRGKNQIVVILDDVTGKLRKDYQISLMSHISGSFQKDVKIEMVLYTILTAVTSGTGLGFNRALLFMVDDARDNLEGKMAVGPDSLEEAIEIWSSISNQDLKNVNYESTPKEGKKLLNNVLSVKYSLNESNIFIKSIVNKEIIHIYDSWTDPAVDKEIKELMDVKEFVIVPMIAVNNPIGIIVVDNKFNHVPIGNDSIELLNIFASQAALSIESHNNMKMIEREKDKIEQRQEGIVESEKMAAVGRIAAHISHEIRNPLVTMGGYARRIIQISKGEGKSGNIEKFSEIILKESERLEKILSNVMDFTKPSKFIKEFNSVNDIIQDTVTLLKNVFLEKKIELVLKLDKEIPFVKSDFNQLKQVMLNLLQNSVEVTDPGGIIEIVSEHDAEYAIIKVKDTGSGINEKDPDVVFEPFYTNKISGVGLGLAIVKKIINDHNGKIEVRNREFSGVEFKIKLPLPG